MTKIITVEKVVAPFIVDIKNKGGEKIQLVLGCKVITTDKLNVICTTRYLSTFYKL